MATEPDAPRLTPPPDDELPKEARAKRGQPSAGPSGGGVNPHLFDRALMATMIGQDALVSLLMAKGLMTDEELTEYVRRSKERIAGELERMKNEEGAA